MVMLFLAATIGILNLSAAEHLIPGSIGVYVTERGSVLKTNLKRSLAQRRRKTGLTRSIRVRWRVGYRPLPSRSHSKDPEELKVSSPNGPTR